METIVVNDTNIFIDLCKINLLNEFFALPLQIVPFGFTANRTSFFWLQVIINCEDLQLLPAQHNA
ncbi:hypothetical protein ACOMSG_10405 [Macellibacteroides fermentans]